MGLAWRSTVGASSCHGLFFGDFGEAGRDFGFGYVVGIEIGSVPAFEFSMFGVAGISHDSEEVFEAGLTTDVFGRRATGAVDELRLGKRRIGRCDGFEC